MDKNERSPGCARTKRDGARADEARLDVTYRVGADGDGVAEAELTEALRVGGLHVVSGVAGARRQIAARHPADGAKQREQESAVGGALDLVQPQAPDRERRRSCGRRDCGDRVRASGRPLDPAKWRLGPHRRGRRRKREARAQAVIGRAIVDVHIDLDAAADGARAQVNPELGVARAARRCIRSWTKIVEIAAVALVFDGMHDAQAAFAVDDLRDRRRSAAPRASCPARRERHRCARLERQQAQAVRRQIAGIHAQAEPVSRSVVGPVGRPARDDLVGNLAASGRRDEMVRCRCGAAARPLPWP